MLFRPVFLVLLVLATSKLASSANCIAGCKCQETKKGRVLEIQECGDNPINLSKETLSGVSKQTKTIGFRNVYINKISNAFEGFTELETITFEHSTIMKTEPQSFELPELSTINFAKTTFGEVPTLHVQYLEELIFDDCGLTKVPNLDHLPGLSFINLANNFIENIGESDFSNLKLEEIQLSNNTISELPLNFLSNNTDLTTLNLNHNPLTKFELNFDSKLEMLSLHNCKLTTFDRSSSKNLAYLTSLDLSGNQISILPIDAFETMKEVTYINLSNNKLIELDDDIFSENIHLDKLVLDHNPFEKLPSFQTKTDALGIQTFSCQNCSLKTVEGVFDNMKTLSSVQLSNNQITDINGAFSEMRHLKELFLSNNKITKVNINSFDKKTELETLDLSGNPLAPLDPIVFALLPSLKMLNVSNCNLKKLWSNYNAKLPSLEKLHIEDNNLPVITIKELAILPKLKVLYLQNNPITCNDDIEILYSYLTGEKTIYPKEVITHENNDMTENHYLAENHENYDLKKAWKSVLPNDCSFYDDNESYEYGDDDEIPNYESTDKNIDFENDDFDDDANVETLMSTDSFSLARASYILSITSVFILTALLVIFVAVMITLLILRRNRNFNMQNGPRLKIPLWHTTPGQKKHSGSVYRPLSEEYSGPRTPIISRYEFKQTPQVHSSVNNI